VARNPSFSTPSAGVALAAWLISLQAQAADAPLTWEKAFPLRGQAMGDVYYAAKYFEPRSGWHELEVWRHNQSFLHRQTDGKLDIYVTTLPGGPAAYNYEVFDQQRHLVIDVDQTNLYRLGIFLDWFGLAHIVDRPKGSFSLTRTAPRADEPQAGCQWVTIEQRNAKAVAKSRVCWSSEWGVPLRIRNNTEGDAWEDRFVLGTVRAVAPGTVVWKTPPPPANWGHYDADSAIDKSQGD
jgi:hypothetical protein